MTQKEAIAAVRRLFGGAGQPVEPRNYGFLVLHYPQTPMTVAWGGAILLAALFGLSLAMAAQLLNAHAIAQLGLAFVVAFLGYEALLYLTSLVLGSGQSAFTLAIVARIFAINAVAFGGLYIIHLTAAGLAKPAYPLRFAAD